MLTTSMREGAATDAIDGVIPRQIVEPDSPEALAETLARASRDRLQTVIRGGGTKIDWGRPASRIDLVVSTTRLQQLLAHRHGDLTATVQAGMRLSELNAALRRHGQWLPIESAFEHATVGGIVATNDSGPLRYRHGTPRDLVIGITLAMTDGRLIKSGGTVVKNVAGYDLGKLISGSHGTLAAIVDVTFKLLPIPAASATLMALYSEPDASVMTRDVAALAASQIEPAAFDVSMVSSEIAPYKLYLRIATSPAAADAQIAAARALVSGATHVVSSSSAETIAGMPVEEALWRKYSEAPWRGDATLRFGWLPAKLPQVLALVGEIQHLDEVGTSLTARVSGSALLRLSAAPGALIAAITRLRASHDVGHVVVLRAPHEVKQAVDVWGPPLDSDTVMRSLKHMFDPAGILNANRGPI